MTTSSRATFMLNAAVSWPNSVSGVRSENVACNNAGLRSKDLLTGP